MRFGVAAAALAGVLACVAPLHAAPRTTIIVDAAYGTGRADSSEDLDLYGLRAEATHVLVDDPRGFRLALRVAFSAVQISLEEEGETTSNGGFANPALLARFAFVRGGLDLGITTGAFAVFDTDRDPARMIYGGFEAARHPYELGDETAVPLIVEARYVAAPWTASLEAGIYAVADGGPQLDDVHLAAGVSYQASPDMVRLDLRVHALFVPPAATFPVYYEPARRAYYGVEAAASFAISGRHRVHVGFWMPFGYDSPDLDESALLFGAGTELAF